MDPFRMFLVNLSDELETAQWMKCAQCYFIPLQRRNNFRSAMDLFEWMIENKLFSSINFAGLKECLRFMPRLDLVEKVEKFENSSIKNVALTKVDIIPSNEIAKINKIGQGAYGTVYKSKYKEIYVAAKEINTDLGERIEKEFLKEVNIMR
jgi:hypothetical protein